MTKSHTSSLVDDGCPEGCDHGLLWDPRVVGNVVPCPERRHSWELGRFERAWWHLRCRRFRLAWLVLRRG